MRRGCRHSREHYRYLAEITEKLICEEVHGETADAEELDEPQRPSEDVASHLIRRQPPGAGPATRHQRERSVSSA
jgi:hypothetical protein